MDEFLEGLLKEAIDLGATDLHFKSQNISTIFMRLKNEISVFKKLDSERYQRLLQYLKFKSKLDYNCLSLPQTGSFQMEIEHKIYYFRLSYLPSKNDFHCVLRILNHHHHISLDKLSHNTEDLNFFHQILYKESGLIVVCGPTGSGKSTTLHCFLEQLKENRTKNILTIEDPIEIYHEDIIQIQVNEYQGLTFEAILQQVLRHDPDIIMIGELRNETSAKIALNLSLTGHLVMTTLHASDGKSALKRLVKLGMSKEDLKQVLMAVITQRLFYTKEKKDPLVIFETLNHQAITQLIADDAVISYVDLYSKINEEYHKGVLSDEDYKKFY